MTTDRDRIDAVVYVSGDWYNIQLTYPHNSNIIFSNTKIGPVLPMMVRGCPENI